MIKDKFNDIRIPDNLDEFIDKAVEKAAYEKQKRTGKYKRIIGGSAACLAIMMGLGIMNPTMAAKVPLIGNVFEAIQDKLEFSGKYSNYADEINETVYDNGVGVTLSEIYCDGESLYVSYLVESDTPFKFIKYEYDPINDYDITKEQAYAIESHQLLYDGEGKVDFSDKELNNSGIAGLEGRYIDEYTFAGVEKYNLREMVEDSNGEFNIPDNFQFSISMSNITCPSWNGHVRNQVLRGNWKFKVDVSVDHEETKIIEVNDINEDGIGLKQILLTPFEMKVVTEHPKELKHFEYIVEVKNENGEDIPMDSGKWSDYSSTTTFKRREAAYGKLKIRLYKDILRQIDEDNYEDIGDETIYEKEIGVN